MRTNVLRFCVQKDNKILSATFLAPTSSDKRTNNIIGGEKNANI